MTDSNVSAKTVVLLLLQSIESIKPFTPCPEKKHPDIFDCSLKKGYPVLIILGTNISGTTGQQITVQYSNSSNVCFCTSCGKNRTNKIWDEI